MSEKMLKMRHFRRPNSEKPSVRGLSMIEVLIAMVIMTIAVISLLYLYNSGQKYFTNQDAHADILNDNREAVTLLSRDIKEALEVVSGPVDIGGMSYTTSTDCIVLKIPSVDSGGFIVDIDSQFDYVVYRIDPDDSKLLVKIVDGKEGVSSRLDSRRILSNNIDSLVISFFDADGSVVSNTMDSVIVDISLATNKKGIQRTFQETVNTRVKLRNKIIS